MDIFPANSSSVSLSKALTLLTMCTTTLQLRAWKHEPNISRTLTSANERSERQRQEEPGHKSESHPRVLGVGVDHIHGLWTGVDSMSQFLFHTVVGLSHLSYTGGNIDGLNVWSDSVFTWKLLKPVSTCVWGFLLPDQTHWPATPPPQRPSPVGRTWEAVGAEEVESVETHTSVCLPRTSVCSQTPQSQNNKPTDLVEIQDQSFNHRCTTYSIPGQSLGPVLMEDPNVTWRLDPGFTVHLNRDTFISEDGDLHRPTLGEERRKRQWYRYTSPKECMLRNARAAA